MYTHTRACTHTHNVYILYIYFLKLSQINSPYFLHNHIIYGNLIITILLLLFYHIIYGNIYIQTDYM